MSNNFISTILFLFLTITGFSQEFVKNFGQSSSESANDIIELSDGNLLIAGSFRDTISNTVDALLMKVDTNGVMIWSKTYGGIQGDDLFNSLIEDNGFIYACGYTTSFTTDTVSDVYLVKTDLNGNISWSETYGGTGCAGPYCGDVGHKIIKEANNSYIISGKFASSGSNLMAGYILRINDTGNIVDEYIVDGVGSEWFTNVSLAQNGDLLFSGVNKVSTWEPWLYRMHPTGYSVFNKGYGTVVDHNYGFGAVEYNNEIFYLSNKAPNICLSKLNQAGDTLMVKEYGASAWIWSEDIFLSSDNNLFILANMGSQSLLMKTDINGDTLWVNYFMNSGFTKKIIEKNNYLYLLGYTSSYGNGSSDITLMKVKSDGSSSNCYETTYPTFFTNPSSVLITTWAEGNTSFTTSNTISPTTTNVSLQECQACIIADFDFSINNNVVTFNNLTEQNVSYDWNFGDLNISSDENPSNTYLTYGIYNVCLVAYDSCSSNTMCKIIEVNNFGCTDTSANNYNPFATVDDSTCLYSPFVFGCTDTLAINYNPLATIDDSSCCYNTGQLWTQIGQDIDGEAADDKSGYSVSLSSDGNTVAIGAYLNDGNGTDAGHVRIFENTGGLWSQIGQDIDGEAADDKSGTLSLSSDGNTVAIGAYLNDGNGFNAGHVRIFGNISGTWTQIGQDIDGEAVSDWSGLSLSLSSDGSLVAIGAQGNDGNGSNAGHVRIFENISGLWTQIGQDIEGEDAGDWDGSSASLSSDGNTVAIGAIFNDGNGTDAGHVRIFENTGGLWSQIGQDIDGEATDDRSGYSVSLSSDGNTVAIGAYRNGFNSGHVRIYENIGGTWSQIGQDIDGEAVSDRSGTLSLSSDGNTVAIGAYLNDGNGTDAGHVRIYENLGGYWSQIGQDIDGEAAGDRSGRSVSLSSDGNTLAIGAFYNDGGGTHAGHVRVFSLDTSNTNPCSDLGCLDPLALNFDPYATVNDSTCVYPYYGCIDSLALNYNSLSNIDDGSCTYCTNDTSYTNITACDSLEWNGEWYDSSGTYYYTLNNTNSNSLMFNGTSHISIVDDPALNWGQNDFSMSAWVNKNNSSPWLQTIISKQESTSGNYLGWNLGLVYNQIRFSPGTELYNGNWINNGTINSNFTLNDNQWYYITGVFDGSNGQTHLYVDGVLILSVNSSYNVNPDNTQDIRIGVAMPIGAPSGPEFFYGKIDNVGIWNRALNISEIQDYMNCSPLGNEADLVGLWNFEEGSGLTVYDQTFNGNDGTINGATFDNDVPTQSCNLTNINGCDSVAILNLTINSCPGCTDPSANNYNPYATIEDSTCLYSPFVFGCTDSLALNYNTLATVDDSSCCYTSGQLWSQIGQDIDGESAIDYSAFAISISSDGGTVAIGAPYNDGNGPNSGHVRVYENIGGSWTQIGQDIDGESASDFSGRSVSLSSNGNTVAIGARINAGNGINSGHVRVYENIGGSWSQIGQDIDGEAAGDYSGFSVSLSSDGSILAIGAHTNDGNGLNSGHVRIYENTGGSWSQIGQDIDGESTSDFSGRSVSLSNDGGIVAIGATNNDDNGLNSGHVRVYENIGGLWSQIGQDIDGEASEDESGHSVSLSSDGNTVAIGAQRNDGNGLNSGHVRIYQNIGGSWFQIGQDIDGEASEDESGFSVSLNADGNTIAIGAQRNDGNGSNSGHVRIYENTSGSWTQIGQDIDGEASDDYNGHSVSLSNDGNTVAIGADGNDGNGTDAGHVRVYNLSTPCADLGCLDPLALNFDPNATVNDSTCIYPNYGCLDLLALNYNSLANIDDGSCNYCTNDTSYTNIISCGSVVWNGVSYTSSGVYSNIYTDLYGCDSTAILDLTINNSTLSTVSITSCDSYVWDGITYFSTGLYTNIYTGINGCDSIIILNLVINNTSSSTLTVTACSSYDWDGFTYDSTGIYTNVYTDINGCDSTVTLDLLINIETSSLTTVTACDSFLWNSITFNNSVFYTIILTNSVGCDSVATLFLTINNSISTTFSDSTCDIYLWDGITYDSTGLYTNIYTSLNGCDSIVTLDLSVVVCYGCTDPLACNFDSTVTIDDGSCLVDYGCTDPLAFNYDSLATCNDGSCIPFIYGCTDPNAINFYAGANTDDGSCIYLGCTDPLACNYDSIATLDDGSCLVDYGCMDPLALNYDSLATCDDSSCIAIIYGCTDSTATNYNPGANLDDGSCIFSGCTDSLALNYNLLAIIDDGSCIYYSCLQPAPINIFTSDITDIRATVNWDNMNSVDCKVLKYNIRFREVGTPTWVTKSGGAGNGLCNFGVNNTSKILYNLDPGTTYQYKIKAYYCFGGSSTWTLPNYFTTDDDCPSINNLSVLTYPANTGKVTFSWDPGNYVFARVLLRVDSVGANWQTAGGFGVYQPNLSVNKFGLQQGQSYRAQARAFCDSNITSYRSWWTNPIFWTQPTIRLGNGTSISHLYVYPNPSRDVFNISFNSEDIQDLSIRILNVIGAEVYRETKDQFIGEYTKQISLDDYGKGIYFLEIETSTGVVNKKLILQ